jgi:tetrahydromethanopterin S-methyltransferase subunit H
MFVFQKEQSVFDFGGIPIGGYPGENPTVLVGGMFFTGQPIVKSTKEGLFDKELAKQWINTGVSMSSETGHPLIIQVFGRTPRAMENHISWLVDNYEGPFMFESVNMRARKRGIEYCNETGLQDRAILNSINLAMRDEEKDTLKDSSISMAVVLGWSPKATSLVARMETIKAMVSETKNLGIEKILIDPATLPVGAGFGLEYRTALAVKAELGFPTCLAPHNAPAAWKFIRQPIYDKESIYMSTVIASNIAAQLFATDCIMYGSMVRTQEVFVATALIGNAIAATIAEANHAAGIDRPIFEPPTMEWGM